MLVSKLGCASQSEIEMVSVVWSFLGVLSLMTAKELTIWASSHWSKVQLWTVQCPDQASISPLSWVPGSLGM